MASEWHYKKGDRKFGPIDAAKLKALADSGAITSDDLVMREGHGQWVKASAIKGLFSSSPQSSAATSPPPPLRNSTRVSDDDDFYQSIALSSQADPEDDHDASIVANERTNDPSEPVSLAEVFNVLRRSRQLLSEINERDKARKSIADLLVLDWVRVLVRVSIAYAIIVVCVGFVIAVIAILIAILAGLSGLVR
jgi:hypothetical protein